VRPAWIDGTSGRYNDVQYLTAVGHGVSRPSCESDAYGAMSKIFNARIESVSTDWHHYFSRARGAGPAVKLEEMNITQLTRISSDKVLKGVKLVEHWDNGAGSHDCLAALERLPAARSTREEIARIDAEISAQVKRGDEASNEVTKFMAYARAMELMQEREALNVDLRIIDVRGRGVEPAHGWEALVTKFRGAKGLVKVGVVLKGNKHRMVQTCLVEALTAQGLEVLEGTSDVDMVIHGDLKWEKAGWISGSQMVRATMDIRLTDLETGRTLAAFSETVKEGRPTLKRAIQLALSKLCKKTSPGLVKKIRASFRR